MIRKILCKLGFHKCDSTELIHLRTEGNKSVCRVDGTCVYCGKKLSNIIYLPRL